MASFSRGWPTFGTNVWLVRRTHHGGRRRRRRYGGVHLGPTPPTHRYSQPCNIRWRNGYIQPRIIGSSRFSESPH